MVFHPNNNDNNNNSSSNNNESLLMAVARNANEERDRDRTKNDQMLHLPSLCVVWVCALLCNTCRCPKFNHFMDTMSITTHSFDYSATKPKWCSRCFHLWENCASWIWLGCVHRQCIDKNHEKTSRDKLDFYEFFSLSLADYAP